MNRVRIEALTPVHIGSGVNFEQNRDYLYFEHERALAVLMPERVLEVISGGQQAQQEDISKWVTAIDKRESILPFLQLRRPQLSANDLARRTVAVVGSAPVQDKPVREQIHGGDGQPLIPGSSLKGAIRTALLDRLIKADEGKYVKNASNLKNRRGQYDSAALEAHYFGKDPNHDALRLLQVGDAYFDRTVCLLTIVANLKRDGWAEKQTIRQFVEAIPQGAVTTARLQFNDIAAAHAARRTIQPRGRQQQNQAPYKLYAGRDKLMSMLPLESLFKNTNDHTAALLEEEIEYWQGQDNPEVIGDYIENLRNLLNIADHLSPKECVLRLGWGTGFLNMTGDWQSWYLDPNDYDDLVDSLRKGEYRDYVFPKTRRFIEGGLPLGYVKLSILE